MKAEELRIGNWVYNSTTRNNMQVYPMMIPQLYNIEKEHGSLKDSNINPISLTEEILLKCGFDRTEYNDYRHPVLIGTLTLFDRVCEIHFGDLYSLWIESLHQLQNLYFSLCGKELEVKL